MTWEKLIATLQAEGLLSTPETEGLQAAILDPAILPPPVPWTVRLLSAFGAWMGSCFVLGSVGSCMALMGMGNEESLFFFGFLLMVAATVLNRLSSVLFIEQLSVAAGLSGLMGVLGGAEAMGWNTQWVGIVLGPLFFLAVTDPILRFASTLTVLGSIAALLVDAGLPVADPLVCVGVVGLVGTLWLPRAAWAGPLRWGALFTAFAAAISGHVWQDEAGALRLSSMIAGMMVVLLAATILHRYKHSLISELGALALGTPVILSVISMGKPGVLIAMAGMGVAFLARDRVMQVVAGIGLFCFGVFFYYNLDFTLWAKAGVLIGSGLFFLGLRAFLLFRRWI